MDTPKEFRIIYEDNLRQDNRIYLLGTAPLKGESAPVAGLSFVVERDFEPGWERKIRSLAKQMVAYKLCSAVSSWHWLFFGATGWRDTDSVMNRHRKFWKAVSMLSEAREAIGDANREIRLPEDEDYRYASCAYLQDNVVPLVADFLREQERGFLQIVPKREELTDEFVMECSRHSFTDERETRADLSSLAAWSCRRGAVLVRFAGGFDDPEYSIDWMFHPDLNL